MLKQVVFGRNTMVQVECILHCTSPENSVQTEYDMQTDT